MKKICLCVGTRPNFIKAAPLIRAFKKHNIPYRLVHTGQHYDYNMAGIFFKELNIPKPDVSLCNNISKDVSVTTQITDIMRSFQDDCMEHSSDIVVVLGDVNSSLACALTAKLMGIKLAHVEAGERCGYPDMAEEANRRLIDRISDYLFCSSEIGYRNLIREEKGYDNFDRDGCLGENFYLVGNTMIDQLKHIQPLLGSTKDGKKPYAVLTLHRAESVDDLEKLIKIRDIILKISEKIKVVFPCHPRTKKQLEKIGILPASEGNDRFLFVKPMSYVEFMKLIYQAKFVLTDSGGLQMETSYLNIPCITLRESTEWLETVASGTNVVTGIYEDDIMNAVGKIFANKWKESKIHYNPLYDSNAADRIVEILRTL